MRPLRFIEPLKSGFIQDTGINMLGGLTPAEHLEKGDLLVVSRNEGSPRFSEVMDIRKDFVDFCVVLLMENTFLMGAPDQKVMTDSGVKSLKDVETDQSLEGVDGNEVKVRGTNLRPYVIYAVSPITEDGKYGVKGISAVCPDEL